MNASIADFRVTEESIQLMHTKYVFSEGDQEYYGYEWKSIAPDNNFYISDAKSTWEGHLGGAPPISNFRIAKDYELGCFTLVI